jgi:hypothetical protein
LDLQGFEAVVGYISFRRSVESNVGFDNAWFAGSMPSSQTLDQFNIAASLATGFSICAITTLLLTVYGSPRGPIRNVG